MATVNTGSMLEPEDLNEIDQWLLDFLADHEWVTPNLARRLYNDSQDSPGDEVSRQWVSSRLNRLREHGHVGHVHPDAAEYELLEDPRDEQ